MNFYRQNDSLIFVFFQNIKLKHLKIVFKNLVKSGTTCVEPCITYSSLNIQKKKNCIHIMKITLK